MGPCVVVLNKTIYLVAFLDTAAKTKWLPMHRSLRYLGSPKYTTLEHDAHMLDLLVKKKKIMENNF